MGNLILILSELYNKLFKSLDENYQGSCKIKKDICIVVIIKYNK